MVVVEKENGIRSKGIRIMKKSSMAIAGTIAANGSQILTRNNSEDEDEFPLAIEEPQKEVKVEIKGSEDGDERPYSR